MNTVTLDSLPTTDYAFRPGLSLERLRTQAPAAFAEYSFGTVSPTYRFISKCGQPHFEINVAAEYMSRSARPSKNSAV